MADIIGYFPASLLPIDFLYIKSFSPTVCIKLFSCVRDESIVHGYYYLFAILVVLDQTQRVFRRFPRTVQIERGSSRYTSLCHLYNLYNLQEYTAICICFYSDSLRYLELIVFP